ncbi:ATP-dependent DNA helicase RecG [Atopobacter phocae]|uniref:ATP-dependent DNA helicase RecG n=1 Tax=Atopobacter phocae TaxID=136492 RepID=UPI0004720B7A|nr:ATP-dependent DNA helicase RecG [Atopobacter phocae]
MGKSLKDSVAVLRSVGQKRIEGLADLGIEIIDQLIHHFPFRYNDIRERDLSEIVDGDRVALKGERVTDVVVSYFGRKKNRLQFKMSVDHDIVTVVFFNQPYLKERINQLDHLAIYGKWDAGRAQLLGMKLLGGTQSGEVEEFEPIYPANQAIKGTIIRNLIDQAFQSYKELIEDFYPPEWLGPYYAMPRSEALYQMHFPSSNEMNQKAREQLVCEEFLTYQLKLQRLRFKRRQTNEKEAIVAYNVTELKKIIQSIPFDLTDGQKEVVNQISKDLLMPFPMNRLLQGDVGSGKTIVAFLAMIATATAKRQSVLMVPTEILAEQHVQSFNKIFQNSGITVELLTGSTKTKHRKQLLTALKEGQIDILIGTHAVFQSDVIFNDLKLAIIDEEHRFGVNQKATLIEKGQSVNVLSMTATPIPRTLAITMYGDLEISSLTERPKNRQPIKTYWIKPEQVPDFYNFLMKEVKKGRQGYIISPLIEESESLDLENATEVFKHLQTVFPKDTVRLDLLHGRLKSEDKEQIMQQFKAHETDVLVSTTVIEVGVDVPNATVMLILDADRFGLSQLHQLRGRVGRGEFQSYCVLVAPGKTETQRERMKIMTASQDGFYLSEKDLEMRGPGQIFGVRQSGIPTFKLGDLVIDKDIMNHATQEVVTQLQKGMKRDENSN